MRKKGPKAHKTQNDGDETKEEHHEKGTNDSDPNQEEDEQGGTTDNTGSGEESGEGNTNDNIETENEGTGKLSSGSKSLQDEQPPSKKRRVTIGGEEAVGRTAVVLARAETKFTRIYTGGTDLSSFERHFRRVKGINDWTDEMVIQVPRIQCEGKAKSFANSLLDREEPVATVDEMFKKFNKKFMSETALTMARAKLEDLRQRRSEDVETYAARFRDVVRDVGAKDGRKMAATFYKGLCS